MAIFKNQSFKKIFTFIFIVSLLCKQTLTMDSDYNKDHIEHVQKPLPINQFKQLSVPLSSTSANAFSIVFNQQPHENLIINYLFDGNCIARSIHFDEMTHFESNDSKNYDFLLQSILKTGALTVATQGSFTFEKPVETQSASFACKSVEFLDAFSAEKNLILDVDYCDNCSDVTCTDIIFKGNKFKGSQFNIMRGSKLNIHGAAALSPEKGLYNAGTVTCGLNAFINTPSFKNKGALEAGILHFDGGKILNEGSVNINDSFFGTCKTFCHSGKMNVHNDCIFQKIDELSTTLSSSWKVGGDWKAHIENLTLEGNSVVGNAALFTIDSLAVLTGAFRAPILYVDSKDLITCNYTAQLFATYYVGLKAKGWIEFKGDIFKTLVQENAQSKPSPKLQAILKAFTQRGVYLHSKLRGIKKSGTIISKNGTVQLHAKKGLTHTGLTDAGFGKNSLLSIHSESLDLQKESLLKALNANLIATKNIDQFGIADIKKQLVMQSPNIVLDGITQAGNLFTQGNKITTTATSQTTTENCSLNMQEKITHAGSLITSEYLNMESHDIGLEKTSKTSTNNTNLKASETITNQGDLNASGNLIARANYINNLAAIIAKNAHIKADRRWWNQVNATVKVENSCVIDALASLNTFGLIQANDLTINAAIDFNFLGAYHAKNTHINALIALNAGIYVPKIDSMDDIFTQEKIWNAGIGLMSTFCPTAGLVYSVGKSLTWDVYHKQSILHNGKEIWNDANKLRKQEGTGVSDWIPLICKAKNTATSAYHLGNSVCQGYNIVYPDKKTLEEDTNSKTTQTDTEKPAETNPNTPETVKEEVKEVPKPEPINKWDVAFKATSSLVTSFGPQINRDTLIDVNCGIMSGINSHSRSLYTMNSGIYAFANNNTIQTYNGINIGISAAAVNNVHAIGTYTNTGTTTGINTTMTANNLNIDGNASALNDLTLQAKNKANINAKINAHNVGIQAKEAELGKNSNINAHKGKTTIVAETVTSGATIQSNVVHMKANVVKLQNGSNISAQEGDRTVFIETKEATFEKGSSIDAHEGTTKVIAKTITNQAAIQGNVVYVKADIVKLQDGSNISAQANDQTVIIEAKESLKADNGSNISGGIVAIDTPSFQGDKENTITSTVHTYINTAHLNNRGSNTGILNLNFTGDASQLKSMGTVDDLRYYGTLENNLPDTLAQGDNNLLNVKKSGSVTINAGNQNVHLKKEHSMGHSLKVKTNGAIKSDKKLTSSESIGLKAKNNLDHKSINAKNKVRLAGKNVTATPNITRTSNGKNSEKHIEQVTVTGHGIKVQATEQLAYAAVKTHSGKGGTIMTADGKNVNAAVECKKHTETHSVNKKTWETKTTKDTYTTTHVCEHTSEGTVHIQSNNDTVELAGTKFNTKEAPSFYGKNGVHGHTVYDTHEHESMYKKNDSYIKKPTIKNVQFSSKTAKPVDFKGGHIPEVTSDKKIAMPFTCDAPKILLNAPIVECHLAMNKKISVGEWEDPGYIWIDGGKPEKVDITYIPTFKGTIETNAEKIRSEEVKNHAPTTFKTTHKDVKITRELFNEIHIDKPNTYCHLTRQASMAIALAATITTSGFGASAGGMLAVKLGCTSAISKVVVTNVITAATTSLSAQTAEALVRNKGDVLATAKDIANTETMKNIALSALTSGALAGTGELLNEVLPAVKDAHNLGERLAYAAPRQLANATIKTGANVIAGKDFKDAALENLKSATANTIGIACTSQIGDEYAKGNINPINHKLLHGMVGGIEGAILGGINGALIGGASAMGAETIADILAPKMPTFESMKELEAELGRPLTQEEFNHALNDKITTYLQDAASVGDIAKFVAVSMAAFSNQDVDIAQLTAGNAVDNNFLVLIGYGLVAADVAYTAYNLYNAYQDNGAQGAFQQLGIEILTHGIGIGIGKVAFKVGGIMYPTAKAAVTAALESAPGLKLALGELAETLTVAGEKYGQSKLGKGIAKIENGLVNLKNNAVLPFSNNKSKLADDLIEHVVPNNIISKMEAQSCKKAIVSSTPSVKIKDLNTIKNEFNYVLKETEERLFLEIKHPVLDNIRTGSAFIKPDPHHAFDPIVDNFARYAKKFNLQGGDKIWKELYQIEGSLNGKNGIFEWIVDPRADRGLTHRFFVKNGTITGKPNIYSGKKNA